jgi:hypothetical protein
MELVKFACRKYIDKGVYDPDTLYTILQGLFPYKHYSVIRRAIHEVKCGLQG